MDLSRSVGSIAVDGIGMWSNLQYMQDTMQSNIVPSKCKRHVASVVHVDVSNVNDTDPLVTLLVYASLALNSRSLTPLCPMGCF